MGLAWLAFDTHGQVIGQSPAAQDVLATTPHIRLDPQHRLRLGDALAERAVLAAVDAASTSTTVVALSRAPLVQLVVTAPPTRVTLDVTSADLQTDLGGLATGGGIGALGPDHAPVVQPGQALQGGGVEAEVRIGWDRDRSSGGAHGGFRFPRAACMAVEYHCGL